MTKEELLKKIDFEKNWLYDCGIFGSDVDIAFHAIKKRVIEALDQEPCEDCISREHLLKEIALLKESPWFKEDTNCAMAIRKEAIEIVEDLCIRKEPSVNPKESKKGHWYNPLSESGYFCTNCESNSDFMYPYCPHCGARMEG